MKITLVFDKAKETKGTWAYTERGDNPKVGSLYLKKSAVEQMENPTVLKVTIEKAAE